MKPRDQKKASFSEKHYGRERFREFQDLIVALDACYKIISISLSRFGDDQRCDFRRRFPASQKILCIVWFICIFFLSQSERDL